MLQDTSYTIMTIYLGADHRGFALKEALKTFVHDLGYEIFDCGNTQYEEEDDYPGFAAAVAEKISAAPESSRGIVLCGSGTGVDIVANKFDHIRSVLALNNDQIFAARHDDDANVLAIAADFTDEEMAKKYTQIFLETSFAGEERFSRRLDEIKEIEKNN